MDISIHIVSTTYPALFLLHVIRSASRLKGGKDGSSSLLNDLQREQVIGNEETQLADNTLDLKWQKPFTSHEEQILSAQKG